MAATSNEWKQSQDSSSNKIIDMEEYRASSVTKDGFGDKLDSNLDHTLSESKHTIWEESKRIGNDSDLNRAGEGVYAEMESEKLFDILREDRK